MTVEEREAMLSKEVLSVKDLMKLLDIGRTSAIEVFQHIKSHSNRLCLKHVVHLQDYIDTYKLSIERFMIPKKERPYEYEVVKKQ